MPSCAHPWESLGVEETANIEWVLCDLCEGTVGAADVLHSAQVYILEHIGPGVTDLERFRADVLLRVMAADIGGRRHCDSDHRKAADTVMVYAKQGEPTELEPIAAQGEPDDAS